MIVGIIAGILISAIVIGKLEVEKKQMRESRRKKCKDLK